MWDHELAVILSPTSTIVVVAAALLCISSMPLTCSFVYFEHEVDAYYFEEPVSCYM